MDLSDEVEAAVATVVPHGRIVGAEPLHGGVSASVTRLFVDVDGSQTRSLVLRRHPDRAGKGRGRDVTSKEFQLLAALAEKGLEVPVPLAVSSPGDEGDWLLIDWVDGWTHLTPDDDDLRQMASFLARLHAVVAGPIDLVLDRIEDPWLELGPHLPTDPLGQKLAAMLGEERPHRAANRVANRDVVLHGDYWPGNVLFHRGRLSGVVDWEDAALGDPLADLAAARVEIACASGTEAADRFTSRYLEAADELDSPALDLTDLPLWEAYVSATALAAMHRWGLEPHDEASRRATTRRCFQRAARSLVEG